MECPFSASDGKLTMIMYYELLIYIEAWLISCDSRNLWHYLEIAMVRPFPPTKQFSYRLRVVKIVTKRSSAHFTISLDPSSFVLFSFVPILCLPLSNNHGRPVVLVSSLKSQGLTLTEYRFPFEVQGCNRKCRLKWAANLGAMVAVKIMVPKREFFGFL